MINNQTELELPLALLSSLKGLPGYDESAFLAVHQSGEQVTSVRVNPLKWNSANGIMITGDDEQSLPETALRPVPWTSNGYYIDKRPSFTFDPFFHAGAYYVQEASSMFLEQAMMQGTDLTKPLRVLDACAAPGGKSTHLLSLLSPDSLLVSNEVIKARVNILRDNLSKWGHANQVITQSDPRFFSTLENYFDVIVVDAPCSGSGLFRKDEDAVAEWSEQHVILCAQRQQRILADLLPALRPGGLLIYSTCSYSSEEDESILHWLENEHEMRIVPLKTDPAWGVIPSGGGYRFWPNHTKGEGLFMAALEKTADSAGNPWVKKTKKINRAGKTEREVAEKYLQVAGHELVIHQDRLLIWPESMVSDISVLVQHLHLVVAGLDAGEIIRDKMIPSHSLALSPLLRKDWPSQPLDFEQAIRYLQRRDPGFSPVRKGWQTVSYRDSTIGWINALPGRINNYYPPELRILKDL